MKKESDRSCQQGLFAVDVLNSRTVGGVLVKKVRNVGYGKK